MKARALILVAVLAGCASVKTRPTALAKYSAERHADVLGGSALSAATGETLRGLGLAETACVTSPDPCRRRLQAASALDAESRLSATAELWLAEALKRDMGRAGGEAALEAFLEAARASYAYLFFTPRRPEERAFDTRQGQMLELYNYATERVTTLLFAEAQRQGRLETETSEPSIPAGSWTVERGTVDVRLPPGRPLAELVPASRLRVVGLSNRYRRDGLGAELVAVAAEPLSASASELPAPWHEAGFVAASAVLDFPGTSLEEVLSTRRVSLSAYDSRRHQSLLLHGSRVPLAASFTAPYALWLERSDFAKRTRKSLRGGGEEMLEPRLHLLEPYDPERQIVVLIHGLASDPETWADLANELTGDEEIRRGFQVWHLSYNPSAPIAYNVHRVRQALEQTLADFVPDAALRDRRKLVLVGHSMGGVIARQLVLAKSDALWRHLLGRAPSDEEHRRFAAAPYLDIEPLPAVSRVVFLASPHRGAPLAGGWLGRLASRLIHLPRPLMALARRAAAQIEEISALAAAELSTGPDGVDFLNPRHPFLEITAELPIADGVAYHTIVACKAGETSLAKCSDGLVPYTSAHLEGAASELVVTSGHSVQQRPEAILELRRILRQHLARVPWVTGRNAG